MTIKKTKKKPSPEDQIDHVIDLVKDGLKSSKSKIEETLIKSYDLLKNS